MEISLFKGPITNIVSCKTIADWDDFQDLCSVPAIHDDKLAGDYFVNGVCKTREKATEYHPTVIVVDGDKIVGRDKTVGCCPFNDVYGVMCKQDFSFAIYTSHSNQNGISKWRLIVPTTDVVDVDSLAQGVAEIITILHKDGLMVENVIENVTPNRAWFLPQAVSEEDFDFRLGTSDNLYHFTGGIIDSAKLTGNDVAENGKRRGGEPLDLEADIVDGERGDRIYEFCCRWVGKGLSESEILFFANSKNKQFCKPPLEDDKILSAVKSAYNGHGKKGVGSKIEILTAEDIDDDYEISLNIPEHLVRPGGLIDLGVEGMLESGLQDIPQFYLPVILSHIANAIAGKIVLAGVWPMFYNVKIAGSSTGKSRSDKILKSIIQKRSDFEGFYGPSRVASGAGILTALNNNPQQLMIMDEMQSLFKRYGSANDPVGDSKREEIIGLYSDAGGVVDKSYGSTKNSFNIIQPCLNILGNTTLGVFDSIKMDDFASGLIPRVDFWCFEGKIEAMKFVGETEKGKLIEFCDKLAGLYSAQRDSGGAGNDLSFLEPFDVFTSECQDILDEMLQEKADYSNNYKNQEDMKALISRKMEIAIRYAMVHHASTTEDYLLGVKEESMKYGYEMATMLVNWKIKVLGKRVTTGDLHRKCELIKKLLALRLKSIATPASFKYLAGRCPELKNWSKKDTGEVMNMLVTREEIMIDNSGAKEKYALCKNKK